MKMLEKSSIHKKGEIYRLILGMSEQYNINMYIFKRRQLQKGISYRLSYRHLADFNTRYVTIAFHHKQLEIDDNDKATQLRKINYAVILY